MGKKHYTHLLLYKFPCKVNVFYLSSFFSNNKFTRECLATTLCNEESHPIHIHFDVMPFTWKYVHLLFYCFVYIEKLYVLNRNLVSDMLCTVSLSCFRLFSSKCGECLCSQGWNYLWRGSSKLHFISPVEIQHWPFWYSSS